MKYKSGIKNAEFYAFHGLYPEEKILGGNYLVDIQVEMEVNNDASMKRISEIVNYERLYSIAKKHMDVPRDLVETVAKLIIDEVGSKFPKVTSAEVIIVKLVPGGVFKTGNAVVHLIRQF